MTCLRAYRDYPMFYTRLYAFLDKDILHLKHRARFFRLTDVFLSSTCVSSAIGELYVDDDAGTFLLLS